MKTILYFLFTVLLCACSSQESAKDYKEKNPIQLVKRAEIRTPTIDTIVEFSLNETEITILNPTTPEIKGTILLLPGWNFSRMDWFEKASLCKKGREMGYYFILPEMGKSIYASKYYPESRKDFASFPTGTWVTDTLIPHIQSTYNLLRSEQSNFICGLSTGARGAALLSLNSPGLFSACAALSGDYHQTIIPKDNLIRGIYGELKDFPERWNGPDNIFLRASEFETPIYLAHGKLDKVVNWEQTSIFYKELGKVRPDLEVIFRLNDSAGHDYTFWDSETEAILTFFSSNQKSRK